MNGFEPHFKLKDNPFRMTPAIHQDEIIWAGFPELKKKLEKRIVRSMKISSSSLVLNWGGWGCGKTHSANYFNIKSKLEKIAENQSKQQPFSIKITFPTGKKPVGDLFTMIIDHIDIEHIRKLFKTHKEDIGKFIASFSQNLIISNIVKEIFAGDSDPTDLKAYLYGTSSAAELKHLKKVNILRKIESDDDRIRILAGLFACLTYRQEVYSCIIIWIDEFESISLLNNVNIETINNFIRELLDNTPNFLLVFLNFTLTALLDVEDLSKYLSESVISRVREKISFESPDEEDLKRYLKELLNSDLYRTEEVSEENIYHPFTEEAIDKIIETIGDTSLRRYNEAFSIMLELAEMEKAKIIDLEFVSDEERQDEIIGWK